MPIIAVEEDYDEVSRLLSNVPNVTPSTTSPIELPTGEPSGQEGRCDHLYESHDITPHSTSIPDEHGNINSQFIDHRNGNASTNIHVNTVTKDEITDKNNDNDDGVDSLGSTFELCSIASYADPLSLSISRSKKLMDRSIGNSNSSRNRFVIIRKASSSQLQLNRSIGSSNSSNRKVGCSSMNQSTHSTGSKLAEVNVVPKRENSIEEKYWIDHSREIGRGTKTIVRKCIERSSGKRYAVKSVRLADIDEYEHMRKEANLLTALNHPSIIKIYDTYEDDKFLHMVVEICKGGELYDYIVKPKNKKNRNEMLNCPSEEVAAVIVHQIVDAVAYLHDHNIVHRDLKASARISLWDIWLSISNCFSFSSFFVYFHMTQLENLLFKTKPNTKNKQSLTDVRIIDFGLSRRYNTHHRFVSLKKLTSFVGTKLYVSPEVLNHSYTHSVDVWSIGVLTYALLSAKAPFMGRNDQELFDKIQSCGEELKFPSPDFDNVSEVAKDFIRHVLVKDDGSRPAAGELLSHPWMVQAKKWKDERYSAAPGGGSSGLKKLFGRFVKNKNK